MSRLSVVDHFQGNLWIELLLLLADGIFESLDQRLSSEVVGGKRRINLATVVENLGDAAAVALPGDLHRHLYAAVWPVIRENRGVFPLLAGVFVFDWPNPPDYQMRRSGYRPT